MDVEMADFSIRFFARKRWFLGWWRTNSEPQAFSALASHDSALCFV